MLGFIHAGDLGSPIVNLPDPAGNASRERAEAGRPL